MPDFLKKFSYLSVIIAFISLVEPSSRFISLSPDVTTGGFWLTTGSPSEVLYARMQLNVIGAPKYAIISLAARDELELWINGKNISSEKIPGQFIGLRYDISRSLTSGLNVIGVKTKSTSRDFAALVRVQLELADLAGVRHFVSDQSWQLTGFPSFTTQKDIADWSSDFYLESPWQPARILIDSPEYSQRDVGLPLYVDVSKIAGSWFWPGPASTKAVTLSQVLDVPRNANLSIGVAAKGYYRIRINGLDIAAKNGSEREVELEELSYFLKPGKNLLQISVVNDEAIPKMALLGQLKVNGNVFDLSNPNQWVNREPVLLFSSLSQNLPHLSLASLQITADHWKLFAKRWASGFFSLFASAVLAFFLCLKLFSVPAEKLAATFSSTYTLILVAWIIVLLTVTFGWVASTTLLANVSLVSIIALISLLLMQEKIGRA